jgi:signal transduction histidine kinase
VNAAGLHVLRPVNDVLDLATLRQTLFNLLSNAAKFTDHGTVRVDVRTHENSTNGQGSTFTVRLPAEVTAAPP